MSLREPLQQQFGLLEDRRVEALGEPAVNWCEEVAGFGAFALGELQRGDVVVGRRRRRIGRDRVLVFADRGVSVRVTR